MQAGIRSSMTTHLTVVFVALGVAFTSGYSADVADSPFPIPPGTNLQLLPCSAASARSYWVLSSSAPSKAPDAQPVTLLSVAGQGNTSCVSCPGDDGPTTSACHMWDCNGLRPQDMTDRNDLFYTNSSLDSPFIIYSYPNTSVFPNGKGLMSDGKCLVPAPPATMMGTVIGLDCSVTGATDGAALWTYNLTSNGSAAGGLLIHTQTGMCLDAGTPFAVNCWTPSSPTYSFPMCDTTLSARERAEDLVQRMTLHEKGQNLGGVGGWGGSAAVPRLGVPAAAALQSSEALHGLVQASCGATTYWPELHGNNSGCATSFPHALALGATFNRSLWGLVGDRISTEARAAFNTGHLAALWLWAPDINLFRDPRWGRGQEVPGEDPFLNGEYAMRWIHAFQYGVDGSGGGGDTESLKALACAKHAFDYDLEDWGGFDRSSFNAVVSDRDQVEYYFPAWRAAVQGGQVGSVMCSYNAVNGVPSCANDLNLNQILRGQFGFDGLVVSDCGAISNIETQHHYTKTPISTVSTALLAGCDADCPGGTKLVSYPLFLAAAVRSGSLPETALDQSLVRLWSAVFRLGLLDDPTKSPFAHVGMEAIDTPASRQLNVEAAVQSMVLLRNEPVTDNGTTMRVLPITSSATVALIGPHFNSTQDFLSDYAPGHWWAVSPLEAAQRHLGDRLVGYAQGCELEGSNTSGIAAAVAMASKADVAVVIIGLSPSNDPTNAGVPPVVATGSAFENEGHDRVNITLQGPQQALVDRVLAANPRTVVVLIHGGAIALEHVKATVPAILDAHYPGQQGGDALMRVLLNVDGASPGGRLTTTVYPADFVRRNMTDMSLDNITYKHYTGTPVWPFGFGLSYSTFTVSWMSVTTQVTTDSMVAAHDAYFANRATGQAWRSPANYTANVTNTGNLQSDYVLLGFVSASAARRAEDPQEPIRELFDFARVTLGPGESTIVHFDIPPSVLSHVDVRGNERLQPGMYTVTLGGEGLGGAEPVSTPLRVSGRERTLFSMEQAKKASDTPHPS
eukprot:m.40557 g.40557  ORF g.40557 m.40557 type:complete len:1020 (+) comp5998_c0_seq1:874-3933(+)